MDKEIYLTREGYEKLKHEYEDLIGIGRKEMAEKIKIAREFGDISENAEYDAAKEEQAFMEKRIHDLDEMLACATIIDENSIDTRKVSIGCTVKLLDVEFDEKLEYKIVGTNEAHIDNNQISNESPLGAALLGKKKGDVVDVKTPAGITQFRILGIGA